MGSRRSYQILPEADARLAIELLVRRLEDAGLHPDPPAYVYSPAATEPPRVYESNPARMDPEYLLELARHHGEVEATYLAADLDVACVFVSLQGVDFVSVSVPVRRWRRLAPDRRVHYETAIARAAADANAVAVLVVDDPADDFWDGVALVDRQWVVDFRLPEGPPYGLVGILQRRGAGYGVDLPESASRTGREVGAFDEFSAVV